MPAGGVVPSAPEPIQDVQQSLDIRGANEVKLRRQSASPSGPAPDSTAHLTPWTGVCRPHLTARKSVSVASEFERIHPGMAPVCTQTPSQAFRGTTKRSALAVGV